MNINFHISKSANKWHFIHTVCGANEVMGKAYLEPYAQALGELSADELNQAAEYLAWHSSMRRENERESKRIMQAYFSDDYDVILQIEKANPVLSKTFKLFDNRFNSYWSKYEKIIFISKIALENDFPNVSKKLNEIFDNLTFFYHDFQSDPSKEISVSLLISPIENMAGRFIDFDKVAIDIPEIDCQNLSKFWALFIHETMHAHYENQEYKNWLRSFANSRKQTPLSLEMGPKNLIRELIVGSFASRGILTERLFGIDIREYLQKDIETFQNDGTKRQQFNLLKKITALQMYETNKEYLDTKKKIDTAYLDQVWEIINLSD